MEGGVAAEPGRPGHAGRQLPQLLVGVGGIGGDVELSAGQLAGQAGDHAAGQPQPRGADMVSLMTSFAMTGTATGLEIIGSRMRTSASTTQLFP